MPKAATQPSSDTTEARFGPKGDAKRRALIRAGYDAVLAQGLSNLTFRTVAAQAAVPLGSVSYYFADKHILILEIINFARQRVQKNYNRVELRVKTGTSWIVALADHVAWVTSNDHLALTRDYEMFLYGFDHPDLADVSRAWITVSNPTLHRILPADLLAPVSYMMEGMFLTSAKTGQAFGAGEVRALLERMS